MGYVYSGILFYQDKNTQNLQEIKLKLWTREASHVLFLLVELMVNKWSVPIPVILQIEKHWSNICWLRILEIGIQIQLWDHTIFNFFVHWLHKYWNEMKAIWEKKLSRRFVSVILCNVSFCEAVIVAYVKLLRNFIVVESQIVCRCHAVIFGRDFQILKENMYVQV